MFIEDMMIYEGKTLEDLKANFENAVDKYLETCEALEQEPQQPYTGSLKVEIGEDLHRETTLRAKLASESVDDYVKKAISNRIGGIGIEEQKRHHESIIMMIIIAALIILFNLNII
jgi:predicted HicB family RNase H-like nuclease